MDIGELSGAIVLDDRVTSALGGVQNRISSFADGFAQTWDGLSAKLEKFSGVARAVGAGLTAAVTVPIMGTAAAAIKLGMDAVEAENLITVSFGGMKQAADEWALGLSQNIGLNRFETEKLAGTLFNMTTSMGFGSQAAFDMSTGIVQLAADMSSFRNIPMEEALIKIKAGLVGEAEPLKAIGILVNETTTKTYAYTHGIAKQGEALTEQQKVLARYGSILAQTSNDQGDLARTLESPANQLRIMKSRITEATTELGMALMPIVSKFTGVIAGLVPNLQDAVKWFTKLPEAGQTTVIIIAAAAAAVGPLLVALGYLYPGIMAVVAAYTAMTTATVTATVATTAMTYSSTNLIGGMSAAGAAVSASSKMIMGMSAAGATAATSSGVLSTVMTALGAVVAGITWPIGLTVAAIVGLGAALWYFDAMDPIIDFFKDVGAVVGGVVVEAFEFLSPLVKDLAAIVGGLLLRAIKDQIAPWKALGAVAMSLGKLLYDWVIKPIADKFIPLLKEAREWLGYFADKFREGSGPVEEAEKGLGKYRQGLEDFKNPLLVDSELIDELSRGFDRTADAVAPLTMKTKEQIATEKAHEKSLRDVNAEIALAQRDVGNLTKTQIDQVEVLQDLGLSNEKIATKMGISALAIKDLDDRVKLAEESWDRWIKKIDDSRDAADKLRPVLGGIGFKMVHEDVTLLKTSTGDLANGITIMGDKVRTTVPLFSTAIPVSVGAAKDAIKDATTSAVKDTNTWGDAVSTLAQDFVDLAQLGGDSFGEVARAIGTVVKSFSMVQTAMADFDKASKSAAGASASDYAALASGYIGVAITVYSMVQAYAAAKRDANQLRNELIAVGKVQKEWGTNIDFTNKVLDVAGQRYTQVAQVIAELGGVARLTSDQYIKLGRAMFDALGVLSNSKSSQKDIQDALALTNTYLADMGRVAIESGGLVSGMFLALVKQARDLGVEVEGLDDLILGQLSEAAIGLNAVLTGLQESATASAQAQAKALGEMTDAEIANIVGSFTVTKEQGAGLAAALVANFAEMIDRGMSLGDALKALAPSIDILTSALKNSGVEGSGSFNLLSELSALAADKIKGPLFDAIQGANQALKGLHNSGILNQEMFTGLELTAVDAYNKIMSGGASAAAANMAIAPTLQTLWSLQQDFGYEVDATTQALINEAIEMGTVGDKHRPIAEQMLLATQAIERAVTALARVMGADLPLSAEEAAQRMTHSFETVNDALEGVEVSVMYAASTTSQMTDQMVRDWNAVHDAATGAAEGYSPSGIKQIGVRAQNVADIVTTTTDRMTRGFDGLFTSVTRIDKGPLSDMARRMREFGQYTDEQFFGSARAGDTGPMSDLARRILGGDYDTPKVVPPPLVHPPLSGIPHTLFPGFQQYATGGIVGTDTVPAMLTPGEGVVTVTGMSRIGAEGLQNINQSKGYGGSRSNGHDDELHQEIVGLRMDMKRREAMLAREIARANRDELQKVVSR